MPEPHNRNPLLFILFRIFFNSRFYYPIYAVMFLDFGLSQEQFAQLNFAWAIAIVLLEVPSGALADQIGRKKLVILAAVLMIVEMSVLLLMPAANPAQYADDPGGLAKAAWILFAVFMANRVISGAAEAAASGADEALAYDSLPEEDRDQHWSHLTTQLMIWQSVGFIVVTIIGAAVYDPDFMNRVFGWMGSSLTFTQYDTLKLPIALTLGMAIVTFLIACRMQENGQIDHDPTKPLWQTVRRSFARTFKAGGWILQTPAALMLLLIGLSFDSIIRLYYTVGSIWLEVIGYRPVQFGIISVAGSITGIFAAVIGKKLIQSRSPNFNFRLLMVLTFIGIFSLAFPIKYWSVLFLPALWLSMRFLHFFISNYLNRVTNSENRATVLSFRGLSMNLSYGIVTMLYSAQVWAIRKKEGIDATTANNPEVMHSLFSAAVQWWWVFLLFLIVSLILYRHYVVRRDWNELLRK